MSSLFIGMPVYNGEKFIVKALEGLLRQTFKDWKLLISDNASTDNTQSICSVYCGKDSRIQYVRQRNNLGALQNFKFLLSEARSPYFMWAASDDELENEFLEACIAGLNSSPEIGWAFTNIVNIDSFCHVIRQYPSFRVFAQTDRTASVASFVLEPEFLGKANLIYGIYKLDRLKEYMLNTLSLPQVSYPAFDMAFNLGILCRTRLYIDERTLFLKRLVRSTDEPDQADMIPVLSPYVNGMLQREKFDLLRQAMLITSQGTQFEKLVSYLLEYKSNLKKDLDFVNEKFTLSSNSGFFSRLHKIFKL